MCVGFNLKMAVCTCITRSALSERSPFNIKHLRSEIEWSGLLKSLATGCLLLLLLILFVIIHADSKDSRRFTYVHIYILYFSLCVYA